MSFNKTTYFDGKTSLYQSPLNTVAYKNRSTSDQDSAEKQQTTLKTQAYSHNLIPKIPNMHLATKAKQQEAIITEESPRLEAEGAIRHHINYFQDRILTAREGSLCFRKALEKEPAPNYEQELISQLRNENIQLKKQQQSLIERISILEKEKVDLLSTLDRTERSLQDNLKSNRHEQTRLDKRLESYREILQEGIQISSKHTSIDKVLQMRTDPMVLGNSLLDFEELLVHVQKVEKFSLDLIKLNAALQTEIENLKSKQHGMIENASRSRFSELERELETVKKFLKENLFVSASIVEKKNEKDLSAMATNKDLKNSHGANRQKIFFVPSAIKALCLGKPLTHLENEIL